MSSSESHSHCHCGCCASMDRREFMTAVGASALAINAAAVALGAASTSAPMPARPRVRAVFLRPKTDKYWMGWPGASYDIRARQTDYTKTMTDAAEKLELLRVCMGWTVLSRLQPGVSTDKYEWRDWFTRQSSPRLEPDGMHASGNMSKRCQEGPIG